MDTVSIDESIRVGVAFDNCRVLPIWFMWRDRYYKVKAVTYTWRTNKGISGLYHYSVTDGANLYELQFNANTLEWLLGKIFSG